MDGNENFVSLLITNIFILIKFLKESFYDNNLFLKKLSSNFNLENNSMLIFFTISKKIIIYDFDIIAKCILLKFR